MSIEFHEIIVKASLKYGEEGGIGGKMAGMAKNGEYGLAISSLFFYNDSNWLSDRTVTGRERKGNVTDEVFRKCSLF